MSLRLPANFAKDIEGNNVNIYPIAVIGDTFGPNIGNRIHISTNAITLDNDFYRPLLLNIPSLKESIDIEKRNYRINSTSISISNLEYEGIRFSDWISGSLINRECRIFWVSQSTEKVHFQDEGYGIDSGTGIVYDNTAFQVYYGKIRKYDHDSVKCKLIVEDKSQISLHKDLPLPNEYSSNGTLIKERWLADDESVPSKYRNAPIPMVYGSVDRSPCVIKATDEEYEDDQEQSLIIRSAKIIIDSMPVEKNIIESPFEDTQYTKSGLYIGFDRKYLSVLEYSTLIYNEKRQWKITSETNPEITLMPLITGSNISDSLIADNNIEIYDIDYPTKMSIRTDVDEFQLGADNFLTANNFIKNIDHYMQIKNYKHGPTDGFTGWYVIYDSVPYSTSTFYESGHTKNYFMVKFSVLGDLYTAQPFDNYKISIDTTSTGDDVTYHELDGSDDVHRDTFNLTQYETLMWEDTLSENKLFFHFDYTATQDDESDINIPASLWYRTGVARHVVIDKFTDKTFYVNVKGRKWDDTLNEDYGISSDNKNASNIIGHILVNELQVTNINKEAISSATGYINSLIGADNISEDAYQHSFTINESISSKTLIENISSTTPIIPRYDYLGKFKFDIIPKNGGESKHTIYEQDVIDYTFTRTKSKEIYTKVEFKYNWNYSSREFDKVVSHQIQDLLLGYSNEHHGLKEDHSDSTLIIDDDRGKYIRHDETAKAYTLWMLSWYCNPHLIMKIKLSLKIGLPIEIGDLIKFDDIIGGEENGVKPYSIDYKNGSSTVLAGYQAAYNTFLVTSTNKKLDFVEIQCIQMHQLFTDFNSSLSTFGCFEAGACNGVECPPGANCINTPCDYGTACWNGTQECDPNNCPEPPPSDCAGVVGGPAVIDCSGQCCGSSIGVECAFIDNCGICVGGNTGLTENYLHDDCGVCNGDGTSCIVYGCTSSNACNYDPEAEVDDGSCLFLDCDNECGGIAEIDSCGDCTGGNTGLEVNSGCEQDCLGVYGGNAIPDCNNDCDGSAVIDGCGVCSGGNTGHSYNPDMDGCGVCNGDNTTCSNNCGSEGYDNYNPDLSEEITELCYIADRNTEFCPEHSEFGGDIEFDNYFCAYQYIDPDNPNNHIDLCREEDGSLLPNPDEDYDGNLEALARNGVFVLERKNSSPYGNGMFNYQLPWNDIHQWYASLDPRDRRPPIILTKRACNYEFPDNPNNPYVSGYSQYNILSFNLEIMNHNVNEDRNVIWNKKASFEGSANLEVPYDTRSSYFLVTPNLFEATKIDISNIMINCPDGPYEGPMNGRFHMQILFKNPTTGKYEILPEAETNWSFDYNNVVRTQFLWGPSGLEYNTWNIGTMFTGQAYPDGEEHCDILGWHRNYYGENANFEADFKIELALTTHYDSGGGDYRYVHDKKTWNIRFTNTDQPIEPGDVNGDGVITGSFEGWQGTDEQLLTEVPCSDLPVPYAGDINGDGTCNNIDMLLFEECYYFGFCEQSGIGEPRFIGDLTGTGSIDWNDFAVMNQYIIFDIGYQEWNEQTGGTMQEYNLTVPAQLSPTFEYEYGCVGNVNNDGSGMINVDDWRFFYNFLWQNPDLFPWYDGMTDENGELIPPPFGTCI